MRAPFPHVERPVLVPRPALVVSPRPLGPAGLLTWMLMITNAERPEWPGDVPIANSRELGLIVPSKIRTAKIAAAETAAATLIGRLDAATLRQVLDLVRSSLGL
ncbi:MAG: mRNA interferase MazF [Sphingomonadales bacterium]|nr:mRNA interferase MazF [Sphingomonadales bacterium]